MISERFWRPVSFFFNSYCDLLSLAVSMTVRINLVLCVCVCLCGMTRMPSVHHLYALVAWCSVCHLLLLHFSFLNEGFSKKENFKLVSSFIDLKIQVQTHGSLVLARKDLGPNLYLYKVGPSYTWSEPGMHKSSKKSRIQLKILCVARRTWRQCRTGDLHKSDVTG